MRSSPDVFLSYSHLDREAAEQLAHSLQARGLKVLWDEPIIAPDEHRVRTTEAIRTAKLVIVLWTPQSLGNRVVQEEAAEAARVGKLVALADGGADFALHDHLAGQSLIPASDGAALTAALAANGLAVPLDGPTAAEVLPPQPAPEPEEPEPIRESIVVGSLIAQMSLAEPDTRAQEPAPVAVVVEPVILSEPALPAPIAIASPPPPPDFVGSAQVSTRPVLRLRRKQKHAAGAARTPLGIAVAGLAMILAVFVLTSGLLHAFGLGK